MAGATYTSASELLPISKACLSWACNHWHYNTSSVGIVLEPLHARGMHGGNGSTGLRRKGRATYYGFSSHCFLH